MRAGSFAAATLASALALASACAYPGVVPVLEAGSLENPADGIPVSIGQVADRRAFQDFQGRSFTPTLAGDANDPELRARAVGRATLSGDAAGANVLLGPGLTVEDLVSQAIGRALRVSGFRVLANGEPGSETATALDLDIEQLWMVENEPTEPAYAEADIRVRIAGPLPGLELGAVVEVRKKVVRGGWSRAMWRMALEKGLDLLTAKAQPELEAVARAVVREAASRD